MKRITAVTILAGVAFGLAACAPSTGTNQTSGQGKTTGTVKMVLWPGPEGDAMGKVVDQYNTGQGKSDDVKVEMALLSRQDTFSKEATLMAAKSADQDIYFVASYNVGQFAASLDPLTTVKADKYFPVAVDGLTFQGQQYALPLDVSNHFLLYRKDVVDTLLADPAEQTRYSELSQTILGEKRAPKPADAWDWDDYKVMAAYFSKTTNPSSPTEYGTILPAKNLLYNTMLWNNVLWGMGGSWTKQDGTANLNTPEGIKAVQLYSDIYTKGWASKDSAQAEFPETQAALKSGNTAFAIQWSAGFAELNDAAKSPAVAGKIAIARVPNGKTHVHALAVALNKYSASKGAALKFMTYLATPDAMTVYAKNGGIPAMPSVLANNTTLNPAFAKISESIDKYGYSEPVFPHTFQAYSRLAETLSGAWVGQTDAKTALNDANSALVDLLN